MTKLMRQWKKQGSFQGNIKVSGRAKLGAQKAAVTILDIFLHEFEGRPGRTVKTKAFYAVWVKRGLSLGEFNGGIAYAIRFKWVELLELKDSYRITNAGYDKTIPSEYQKPVEPAST